MAADRWQLAAMYKLAATDSGFRTVLANSATPSDLQSAIGQGGWAGSFPGAVIPLLSTQQLAAAQGSPDVDEVNLVANGSQILEGSIDAWAIDYVTGKTVRINVIQPGDPGESQQAGLL